MKLPKVFAKWFGSRSSGPEKQLLLRCRGDAEQTERLIRHELTRHANWSRELGAQAALERWIRDR